MTKLLVQTLIYILFCTTLLSQHISEFSSIPPGDPDKTFRLASSHSFQYIIEHGDPLSEGGTLPDNCDFTAYVAIGGSSDIGYLSINSEATPGGVTILDISLDNSMKKWMVNRSEAVDFSVVSGTVRNCSGAITPWNTIITCEEATSADLNGDGYKDMGWAIEIDPETKKIVDHSGGLEGGDKLWALGNFRHENAVIHENRRTVYQGVDDNIGYLYKFVADQPENLSVGKLFVYKGSKQGSGEWILINNTTQEQQNSTLSQSANVEATLFAGIEDVDISPIDGKIYLAVKNEDRVYRFDDSDPVTGTIVANFETYVGGQSYEIGNDLEPWGSGNDNLVFDDRGNLWVTQDGNRNYVWLVEEGHSQANPKVKIFAQAPQGSEPTGITFTPDYKYLFMSIQHPSSSNSDILQADAFGMERAFDKDVSIVIALSENLNDPISNVSTTTELEVFPNPVHDKIIVNNTEEIEKIFLIDTSGKRKEFLIQEMESHLVLEIKDFLPGVYLLKIFAGGGWTSKKILITK